MKRQPHPTPTTGLLDADPAPALALELPPKPAATRTDADHALVDRLLTATRAGVDVRARKIRRLKAAIKVGVYENDLKLDVAVERLLDALSDPSRTPKRA